MVCNCYCVACLSTYIRYAVKIRRSSLSSEYREYPPGAGNVEGVGIQPFTRYCFWRQSREMNKNPGWTPVLRLPPHLTHSTWGKLTPPKRVARPGWLCNPLTGRSCRWGNSLLMWKGAWKQRQGGLNYEKATSTQVLTRKNLKPQLQPKKVRPIRPYRFLNVGVPKVTNWGSPQVKRLL